ncbi:MAG: hypothetical protein MI924_28665, partial [Chloroflexales bacterium]|nr:hypothetical protein [Chloroflexales bacterium]
MTVDDTLLRFWGKTPAWSTDPPEKFHPAIYHMLDVAFVAEALLSDQASPRLRQALLHAWAGCDLDALLSWLPFLIVTARCTIPTTAMVTFLTAARSFGFSGRIRRYLNRPEDHRAVRRGGAFRDEGFVSQGCVHSCDRPSDRPPSPDRAHDCHGSARGQARRGATACAYTGPVPALAGAARRL